VPKFVLGAIMAGSFHRYSVRASRELAQRPTAEIVATLRASRLAGLRLATTDQEWAYGNGHEVAGPSEAVALAIAGRPAALADLAGDGVPVIRARLSTLR
jgi:hypothetical protein